MNNYKEIFTERGDTYHEAMLSYPQVRKKEFEKIIEFANLKENMTVLDYPSGGGYLQNYLNFNINLKLIETSEVFYDYTKMLNENNAAIESFLCLNDTIPLQNETIDRAISLAGIHHVENKKRIYREISRCLKKGGKFALADVSTGSKVDRFLNVFVDEFCSMGHKGVFLDKDSLANDLQSCNLLVNHLEPISYYWEFDSEEQMVLFCKQLFGLDKASYTEIYDGIDSFLGVKNIENKFCFEWQLLFCLSVKP